MEDISPVYKDMLAERKMISVEDTKEFLRMGMLSAYEDILAERKNGGR